MLTALLISILLSTAFSDDDGLEDPPIEIINTTWPETPPLTDLTIAALNPTNKGARPFPFPTKLDWKWEKLENFNKLGLQIGILVDEKFQFELDKPFEKFPAVEKKTKLFYIAHSIPNHKTASYVENGQKMGKRTRLEILTTIKKLNPLYGVDPNCKKLSTGVQTDKAPSQFVFSYISCREKDENNLEILFYVSEPFQLTVSKGSVVPQKEKGFSTVVLPKPRLRNNPAATFRFMDKQNIVGEYKLIYLF